MMVNFMEVKYSKLTRNELNYLFFLRKETFKDRLNWEVECTGGLEMDKYDNPNATYIIGTYRGEIVCGARLIKMNKPNMIRDNTFKRFFNDNLIYNDNTIELSRFFIDKKAREDLGLKNYPLTPLMFINIINHSINEHADSLCAVVSRPAYIILIRSGWSVRILQSGISEKNEDVYYITLPLDEKSTSKLNSTIRQVQRNVETA